MGVSKRKYGVSFKARVALEAIREKKTIHSFASSFEIYSDAVIFTLSW